MIEIHYHFSYNFHCMRPCLLVIIFHTQPADNQEVSLPLSVAITFSQNQI